MPEPLMPIADASTFWTALGAIGSMVAAAAAVLVALVYTRRQTELTRRAADNARVSAVAATQATSVAREALTVSEHQLGLAREEFDLARAALEAAHEANRAADRPLFDRAILRWSQADRRFHVLLVNVGKGPGQLRDVLLNGPGDPPAFSMRPVSLPGVSALNEQLEMSFDAPAGLVRLPTGQYVVSATIEHLSQHEDRTAEWLFDVDAARVASDVRGHLRLGPSRSDAI